MTTARSRQLSSLLRQVRSASDPDIKRALVAVSSEIRSRLESGSKESHDFFVSAAESIQEIRGSAHSHIRAECLFDCCKYFYLSGIPLLALGPARQALKLVERAGNVGASRKALNLLGILCADTGSLAEAIECYSAALEIARDTGDGEGEATTWLNLGIALTYMSRYQEALRCLDQVGVHAPAERIGKILCQKAAHSRSVCLFNLGDFESAKASVELSIAGTDEPANSGDLYSRIVREHHYMQVLLELGEFKAARERLEIASRFAAKANIARGDETIVLMEGLIDAYCGDASRGLEKLENLLSSARNATASDLDVLTALARSYEQAGRNEKALDCLQAILKISRSRREEDVLRHIALAGGALRAPDATRQDLSTLHFRQAQLRAKLAEQNLFRAQVELLERLAITADLREEESGEHGYRVGKLASLFAEDLGWSKEECLAIELAARLHDIGKIGIPDRILLSTAELQKTERNLMCAHASVGAEILARSSIPQLRMAEEIARCHHEWWDGTGYPSGLSRSRIPVHARIVALADVFDAMTHGRPYENAWPVDKVLEHISDLRERQFDPALTDRFVALVRSLKSQHDDLDRFLGEASRHSTFIRARQRIQEMLSIDAGAMSHAKSRREFDLSGSKS